MPRVALIALALVGVLVLSACTEQEPSITLEEQVPAEMRDDDEAPVDDDVPVDDDIVETVELIAGDIYYDNEPSTLPEGTTRFIMENEGNLPHDLIVEELGDREIIPEIMGGETAEGDVGLDAGDYTFYCSVPGHREAGMEFEVEVSS